MNTHTPGPWTTYNSHGTTILRNWRIGESNTTPGVTIPVATVANEDMGRSPEEQYANARLIAAAPQLLDALEQAMKGITEIEDGYFTIGGNAVAIIRAAINKARNA